jgi:hypothetical protein
MPGCFRRDRGDLLACFLPLHARPRAHRAPGIPCSLCMKRARDGAKLGRVARRECESVAAYTPSFRGVRSASPESLTPAGSMDSGPAPRERILRCAIAHRGMTKLRLPARSCNDDLKTLTSVLFEIQIFKARSANGSCASPCPSSRPRISRRTRRVRQRRDR